MGSIKHWLWSITIPSLLYVIFTFVYSSLDIKQTEHKCTYLDIKTCIVKKENSDTIKNIDLNKYEILDRSTLKINQEVIYKLDSVESKKKQAYFIAGILCFILFIIIRFPGILSILTYL